MKIVVVSGSTRAESQSLKVAEYLKSRLEDFGTETDLVDLNVHRLPLYDDSESGPWQEIWNPIESKLENADGFVLVSPEWDGMFSVGLHNMFNYVASGSTKNTMAHKPVTLVGVSSGMGGVYPIAQLRMTGSKNTHYVVSPESLRFAKVKDVLVDGRIVVNGLRERTDYALKVLIKYAEALAPIRRDELLDFNKFGSGV